MHLRTRSQRVRRHERGWLGNTLVGPGRSGMETSSVQKRLGWFGVQHKQGGAATPMTTSVPVLALKENIWAFRAAAPWATFVWGTMSAAL